ncbi:hypothetical protein Lalb_Chr10g0102141 [Lupinus albus]|uniref:Uncharacterized protein n=1 Tax=Lupinus albus TaxID=3870 RepID=A0A6A4PX70_LUPAL|nr:hypothetical protein Lalb_Chr10g0102141 [Lupinus albus]
MVTINLIQAYVIGKMYKEEIKKIAQEEVHGNGKTNNKKIHKITKGSSTRCFSWLSKQRDTKYSQISDSNH